MKTLFVMMSLAILGTACSHSSRNVASVGSKCESNGAVQKYDWNGRDPYRDSAQESVDKEFNLRLSGFLSDCDVQKEISDVAQGNSIEVTGFNIQGLMGELSFNVQDFTEHTNISCKIEAGEGLVKGPSGSGPQTTVAYTKKVVKNAVCTEPVRN